MRRYINLIKANYFIELLKLVKRNYTLNELSNITGESSTSLSRYIHGHVIPSPEKVDRLLPIIERISDIEGRILSLIKVDKKTGFINNQALITDISLLRLLAMNYAYRYANKVDIIISPAADGIPFATLLAEYLGINLIIVKNKKEIGVSHFVEGIHITEDGMVETLYFPRRLIRKGYRALIVDDVIRTGGTHKSIVEMVSKVKARVVGILVILVLGDSWREKLSDIKVDYVVKV
jgi:adenine phosphoribosyltransferase